MWNETGTLRLKFSRKIRNGSRFKMRWKLFCFVLVFKLIWNISAFLNRTELTYLVPTVYAAMLLKKKKDHERQYLKKHNFISCILESHTRTQLSLHFRLLPPACRKHHQLSYRNSWSNYGSWGTHKLWKQEAERGGPQQLLL